jgi:hypothetical protein
MRNKMEKCQVMMLAFENKILWVAIDSMQSIKRGKCINNPNIKSFIYLFV